VRKPALAEGNDTVPLPALCRVVYESFVVSSSAHAHAQQDNDEELEAVAFY
jgi:hypothetical protein